MVMPSECVIVANGQFPVSEIPLRILREASDIIACDGAVENLCKYGFTPTAIVGDLDSLTPFLAEKYKDIIYHNEDQETNDLTKAVALATKWGKNNILILGATGLREDHTLGNISLLTEYQRWVRRIEIVTDYGIFTPFQESATFSSYTGQQVSIFLLDTNIRVTTEGLRWPITDRILTSWWQGTLNESLGDSFKVSLMPSGKAILYRLF